MIGFTLPLPIKLEKQVKEEKGRKRGQGRVIRRKN